MIAPISLSSVNKWVILAVLLAPPMAVAQSPAEPGQAKVAPVEIVLVEAKDVTPAAVSRWKNERFQAVAVVLDEQTGKAASRDVARHISDAGLDLYWWIEVARNPKLAAAHPRWMAGLGSHADWQKRFPKFPEPRVTEVAKAFPWVPIGYAESFDAHLARIQQMLQGVPSGWRGLLLNDLQAGPSSCGCGNLQCRWALDYHVPSTATKLQGDDVAVRFIAEVRKRAGDKPVIPIWTTECAEVDMPPDKHRGLPGTGLCGSVGCATGACPDAFASQFSALMGGYEGPVGLLALHTALQRHQKEFGGGPGWLTNALSYVDETLRSNARKVISPQRLWVVVEGLQASEEAISRELARKAGVGAVIVARGKMDQTYEPKMVRLE